MKKVFVFMLCCLAGLFFVSCGGGSGESSGGACESNLDCPTGQICSAGGCIKPGSSDDGKGEGEGGSGDMLPDDERGSNDGDSTAHDGDTPANDDDNESANDDQPLTGDCNPGETDECGYQGPPETENVGPCKAAVRTCQENGKWGRCEGEVLPTYESDERCNNGIDDDCNGFADELDDKCKIGPVVSDEDEMEEDDSDVAHCDTTCPTMINLEEDDGCLKNADGTPKNVNENTEGLCNGIDDDCDGKIDEGCPCTPGLTQKCFSGKPKQRGVGTCHDGEQTCKASSMRAASGDWGDSKCIGEILPKKDVCDNADNNCNGCADEGLCCAPPIDCDFNIGTAKPFADKIIDGKQIYDASHQFNDADTVKWEWTLTRGNCDIVLNKTSFTTKGAKTQAELAGEGSESTVVSGTGLSQFKVRFKLSGSYTLHLKVTRANGDVHECEWTLDVVSDGLRVELCWDKTGSSLSGGRDIDLYLGKNGVTTGWRTKSCYFSSCKGDPSDSNYNWSSTLEEWGYGETSNYNKEGVWTTNMKNPRLDMDNISTPGKPENINVDEPKNGDNFRVMVHYYTSSSGVVHPVVNVYCGGTRKATFGGNPSDDGNSFNYNITNFDGHDDSWKVTEINWVGGYSSNECVLTPNGAINNAAIPDYSNW